MRNNISSLAETHSHISQQVMDVVLTIEFTTCLLVALNIVLYLLLQLLVDPFILKDLPQY